MTLEQRAKQIARAAREISDRDGFEDEVAQFAYDHLVAVSVETAARVTRRCMASERPAARSN